MLVALCLWNLRATTFVIPSLCIYSLALYQKGVIILTVCAGISFTPKAYLSLFHQAVNQTRIIVVPRKLF